MRDQTPLSNYPLFSFLQSNLCRMTMLVTLLLFWLLTGANLRAETSTDLPVDFGAVVYQRQGDAPTQLFIIANSHRSMLSGANGDKTLQAQVETFQIGEWLIRRRQVGILFPEGFFGSRPAINPVAAPGEWLDSVTLTRWLADTSSFVNAELLLHEQYGIHLQQVEDRELYYNVRDSLIASQIDNLQPGLILDGQLESLQKRRSTAILQSATALSLSNSLGSAAPSSAILTIGLAHLGDILEFIESGEIQTADSRTAGADLAAVPLLLDSYKRPVGITVIVPHSLLKSLPLELVNRT